MCRRFGPKKGCADEVECELQAFAKAHAIELETRFPDVITSGNIRQLLRHMKDGSFHELIFLLCRMMDKIQVNFVHGGNIWTHKNCMILVLPSEELLWVSVHSLACRTRMESASLSSKFRSHPSKLCTRSSFSVPSTCRAKAHLLVLALHAIRNQPRRTLKVRWTFRTCLKLGDIKVMVTVKVTVTCLPCLELQKWWIDGQTTQTSRRHVRCIFMLKQEFLRRKWDVHSFCLCCPCPQTLTMLLGTAQVRMHHLKVPPLWNLLLAHHLGLQVCVSNQSQSLRWMSLYLTLRKMPKNTRNPQHCLHEDSFAHAMPLFQNNQLLMMLVLQNIRMNPQHPPTPWSCSRTRTSCVSKTPTSSSHCGSSSSICTDTYPSSPRCVSSSFICTDTYPSLPQNTPCCSCCCTRTGSAGTGHSIALSKPNCEKGALQVYPVQKCLWTQIWSDKTYANSWRYRVLVQCSWVHLRDEFKENFASTQSEMWETTEIWLPTLRWKFWWLQDKVSSRSQISCWFVNLEGTVLYCSH